MTVPPDHCADPDFVLCYDTVIQCPGPNPTPVQIWKTWNPCGKLSTKCGPSGAA